MNMAANTEMPGELLRKPFEVYVPGATPEELDRGFHAACEVFLSAKCHPMEAAAAFFDLEGEEFLPGRPFVTQEEVEAASKLAPSDKPHPADVWLEADAKAAAAICQGWRKPSDTANLAIETPFEELVADVDDGFRESGKSLPER